MEAPPEWNVTDLGVGDTITPDMWDDNKHGYGFGFIGTLIHEPIKIVGFDEDSEGKFVKLQKSQSTWQKIRNKQNDIVELDISEVNGELKSQFRIVYPTNETKLSSLLETDDEFSVDAPEEWNYDYWEPTKGTSEDEYYKSFDEFATRILKKYGVEDEAIESYLDEIYNFGDVGAYEGISSKELYEDFGSWTKAENDDDDWYNDDL